MNNPNLFITSLSSIKSFRKLSKTAFRFYNPRLKQTTK